MLFEKTFEIVEIHKNSGVTITHWMRGTRKQIKKEVEMCKRQSKDYQMVGKNGMIVWV